MSVNPDNDDFPYAFMKSFLEGYRQENELNEEILKQIPLFLKYREVFLFTLFHEVWDFAHLQDWQTYTLQDLRHRIKHRVPYTDVDFSALL
ncbi:hypothetical protein [Ectobacillus panaciterrae]|uniref:hypothetical protein n=1 Tax=Ectobacillus panaciterrae TaxID=363872 RepID=UPI0003FE0148|nr:hypothetical protein [Ectobacillus panaciterrae]